jgi:hypothetical protein
MLIASERVAHDNLLWYDAHPPAKLPTDDCRGVTGGNPQPSFGLY